MDNLYIDYYHKAIFEKEGKEDFQCFKFACEATDKTSMELYFSEMFYNDQRQAIKDVMSKNGITLKELVSCSKEVSDDPGAEIKDGPIGYLTVYPKVELKNETVMYGMQSFDFRKFIAPEDYIKNIKEMLFKIVQLMYEQGKLESEPVGIELCSQKEFEDNNNHNELVKVELVADEEETG